MIKLLLLSILVVNLAASSKIEILDTKVLNIKNVYELSALAYDGETLYALSDTGILHHLKLDIQNNKINSISLLKSKKLRKKKSDTEGMVFAKNKLYISFERKPKVIKYSLNGTKIKKYKIPKILRDIDNYQAKNKSLEAIAYHKDYGVLVAPERPLVKDDKKYHTLYAKDKNYKFIASGSLSALEFIRSGEVMALERDFNFFTFNRVITLSKIYLDECFEDICKTEVLAKLKTTDGYDLDNFEGLTKLYDNKYLMVSDDNRSMFQKTLFVLFELKEN
jgi:hypothetical protein